MFIICIALSTKVLFVYKKIVILCIRFYLYLINYIYIKKRVNNKREKIIVFIINITYLYYPRRVF